MTPKEAVEILSQAETVVAFALAFGYDGEVPTLSQYRQALTTITHYTIPRTEPPTEEEVGDNEQCLVVYLNGIAGVEYGKYLRRKWQNGVQWLPIPQVGV
jgi:hypothetical protein